MAWFRKAETDEVRTGSCTKHDICKLIICILRLELDMSRE